MLLKKRKVAVNLTSKAKKRRKFNLSDESEDINSFNKELAEIAERDPELYQFLKEEEADIFDEQDNDGDESEGEREDDELSDDEISKSEGYPLKI